MNGSNVPAFTVQAALALLVVGEVAAQQSPSPFGLRNTEKLPPGWTPGEFQGEFLDHEAGYLAFWLFWGEVETVKDCQVQEYDFTILDERLEFAKSIGADPVVVFHLGGAFGEPSFEGMETEPQECQEPDPEDCYTGPCDLDTVAEPVWPPNPILHPQGYSPLLYDIVFQVAERMAESLDPFTTVRFRFHNEAWSEWPIGSTPTDREKNLDNYLRSYLTVRLAVEAAEVATFEVEHVNFLVGHGSIPRGRLVPTFYYDLGELDPLDGGPTGLKPWALQRLNAYTERNRCFVESKYGIVPPIDTWQKATAYAGPGAYNNILDAWMDRFVTWTAAGYFDFTTQHPHDKPYFLQHEQELFEERVTVVPGAEEPPPWFAAETAFEMLDQQYWGVIPCTGPAFDTFVAEDYARKWCTLLANDTPFCSPIIGGPHPAYVGLYAPEPRGDPSGPVGCMPDCGEPVSPVGCIEGICPLPSNNAFQFLSAQIGLHAAPVDDLSANTKAHYRFNLQQDARDPRMVDVVWRRTLFDSASAVSSVTMTPPTGGYTHWEFYIVQGGAPLLSGEGQFQLPTLGQSPRVIVWRNTQP